MSHTDEMIQQVWNKGPAVTNYDSTKWRKDQCTAWISRTQYGNRSSMYGCEIDHINPKGGDTLSNLRPLQWKNNVAKGEGGLKCVVISEGNKNKEKQST